MPRYMTASYGWAFRQGSRVLLKEPSGIRHAVQDGADQTLCGWYAVSALTCFPDVGFATGPPADRCAECALIANAIR
jgi:hypothetical protein